MQILIYTYGNPQMGMGHIYRMLNLADELQKRKHMVLFLVPAWKEGVKKIREKGKKVIKIPVASFEQESTYRRLIKNYEFGCIIVDALAVSSKIMKMFKEKTKILVSLDNTGQGRLVSDILINALYRRKPKLKKPKIEINDFQYLILNKNFKNFNLKKKKIKKRVKKILITQGSDTYDALSKIINELNDFKRKIEYYVLLSPAFKHRKNLTSSIKKNNLKVEILENIQKPWKLFYKMDVAISAAGMTLFELLCVGVPCIVLTQEYKEIETINYLKDLGLIEVLGLYDKIKKNQLLTRTEELTNNYQRRIKMSKKSKKTIDGTGTQRLVNLIENRFNKINKNINKT